MDSYSVHMAGIFYMYFDYKFRLPSFTIHHNNHAVYLNVFSDHVTYSKTQEPVVIEVVHTIHVFLVSEWCSAGLTEFYIQRNTCKIIYIYFCIQYIILYKYTFFFIKLSKLNYQIAY